MHSLYQYIHEKRKSPERFCIRDLWRRHPDLNRGIEVLQTSALPLGYSATGCETSATITIPHIFSFGKRKFQLFFSFLRISKIKQDSNHSSKGYKHYWVQLFQGFYKVCQHKYHRRKSYGFRVKQTPYSPTLLTSFSI